MKKMALLLAVSVCVLTPSTARANDGGFWDMLFRWDPKFFGFGTDFHILCLDKSSGSESKDARSGSANAASVSPTGADIDHDPSTSRRSGMKSTFVCPFMYIVRGRSLRPSSRRRVPTDLRDEADGCRTTTT